MSLRFDQTSLVQERGRLQLRSISGSVLFELQSSQTNEAIRLGFLDPTNLHYSLFQYARMTQEAPLHCAPSEEGNGNDSHGIPAHDFPDFDSEEPEDDAALLRRFGIRWE